MNNYKHNFRRNRFKSNGDRHYRKRNGNGNKNNAEFSNGLDFKRKNPGRNNQNASKLIEKYNDLAKEAISNGDKILSENYLQHADHFTRVLNERENFRREKFMESKAENITNSQEESQDNPEELNENNLVEVSKDDAKVEKSAKPQAEIS